MAEALDAFLATAGKLAPPESLLQADVESRLRGPLLAVIETVRGGSAPRPRQAFLEADDFASVAFLFAVEALSGTHIGRVASAGEVTPGQLDGSAIETALAGLKVRAREDEPDVVDSPRSEGAGREWVVVAIIELEAINSLRSRTIANRFAVFETALMIAERLARCHFLLKSSLTPSGVLCQRVEELLREAEIFVSSPPTKAFSWGPVVRLEEYSIIFESRAGAIQVGVPAETIKRSLAKGRSIPAAYVLPPQLFSHATQSMAEIEFPVFFSFFVNKAFLFPERRVQLVGAAEALAQVLAFFKESVVGPDDSQLYVEEELADNRKDPKIGYFVDLRKEMEELVFRLDGKTFAVEDFFQSVAYDRSSSIAELAEGTTIEDLNGLILLREDDVLKGAFDANSYSSLLGRGGERAVESHDQFVDLPPRLSAWPADTPWKPPTFGVTFLGTSHGFDHGGDTTGFIIWCNGIGCVVDPPTSTVPYLRSCGLPLELACSKIILTHCHSDHDSGLLKLLSASTHRPELFTTRTVFESYVRKMSAILGTLDIKSFLRFRPVKIGELTSINGAKFEFDYSFHAIPCVRFKATLAGKTISYSADTKYDPTALTDMCARGVISPIREQSLRMFVWDADLIIHESGVPPIHTPISILNEMPQSIKARLCVVHCGGIPDDVTGLRIPECGLTHTISVEVGPETEGYALALQRSMLLSSVRYFRGLSSSSRHDLLLNMDKIVIKEGESHKVCHSSFYMVESGHLWLIPELQDQPEPEKDQQLSYGDCFGERALISSEAGPYMHERHEHGKSRVVASTYCSILVLSNESLQAIRESPLSKTVAEEVVRAGESSDFVRRVLRRTFLFENLPTNQVSAVAAELVGPLSIRKGEAVFKQGDTERPSMFIVKSGCLALTRQGVNDRLDISDGHASPIMQWTEGRAFGEIATLTGLPRTGTVSAIEDSEVFELSKEAFDRLQRSLPQFAARIAVLVEERLAGNRLMDVDSKDVVV